MKTAQILPLEESLAYGFKHLGLSSHCEMITIDENMVLPKLVQTLIESIERFDPQPKAIVNSVMVADNTICDTDKTKLVELKKLFITHNGINVILEMYDYYHYEYIAYTFKYSDYLSLAD
jgi:hypothetical protein